MRLINAHTLLLEGFIGQDVPEYAILSHTWGDEEVTFQEISTGTMKTKSGYNKIEHACRQAIEEGLDYCWVDTCCIDKSSSSELSEAINSMFRWYAAATVCFVYLEDIELSSLELNLPSAKWFTRGWTLQELLAPQLVCFYDKQWQHLGTLPQDRDLLLKVSKITGVPPICLEYPSHVASQSIARRMSWASKRKTTRTEDMAYCLLGIFGVNMPLLYGEAELAFNRLQEEIIKISPDQSILAWGGLPSQCFLAPSPAEFVNACNIISLHNSRPTSTIPHSITNRGLRLQAYMWTDHSRFSYIALDCYFESYTLERVSIKLSNKNLAQPLRLRCCSFQYKGWNEEPPKTIYLPARSMNLIPFNKSASPGSRLSESIFWIRSNADLVAKVSVAYVYTLSDFMVQEIETRAGLTSTLLRVYWRNRSERKNYVVATYLEYNHEATQTSQGCAIIMFCGLVTPYHNNDKCIQHIRILPCTSAHDLEPMLRPELIRQQFDAIGETYGNIGPVGLILRDPDVCVRVAVDSEATERKGINILNIDLFSTE